MPVIKGKAVTDRQKAVYDVLSDYGPMPDHALVPLAQHAIPRNLSQSSSGIRSRRAELCKEGLVKEVAKTKTASGRSAGVFEVIR